MKTVLRISFVVASLAAISQATFAAPPPPLPDGGASAVLVAIGAAGLVAARGIFRKK